MFAYLVRGVGNTHFCRDEKSLLLIDWLHVRNVYTVFIYRHTDMTYVYSVHTVHQPPMLLFLIIPITYILIYSEPPNTGPPKSEYRVPRILATIFPCFYSNNIKPQYWPRAQNTVYPNTVPFCFYREARYLGFLLFLYIMCFNLLDFLEFFKGVSYLTSC